MVGSQAAARQSPIWRIHPHLVHIYLLPSHRTMDLWSLHNIRGQFAYLNHSTTLLSTLVYTMNRLLRNKREQLRKGKKTLFKKAHKLATVHKIDIAIIMRQNDRYYTYRSMDQESWPPTMKQIVGRCLSLNYRGFNVK